MDEKLFLLFLFACSVVKGMPGGTRLLDEVEEDWIPQNNGRRRYAIPEKIDNSDDGENEEDEDTLGNSDNWQRLESATTPRPIMPIVSASRRFDRTPHQPKNAVRIDTSLLNGESVELPTYINVPVTLKCKFVKVHGTDNKFETVVEGMYPGHTTSGSQLDHPSSQILQQLMDTAEKWRGTVERPRSPRKVIYEDDMMSYDQDVNSYGRYQRYAKDKVQNEENLQQQYIDQVDQTEDNSDENVGELQPDDEPILETQQIDIKQQTNIDQQYDNEQANNDQETDNNQLIDSDQQIDNNQLIDSDQQTDNNEQVEDDQQVEDDPGTYSDTPSNNDEQTDDVQKPTTDQSIEEEVTEIETENPHILKKSIGQRVVEAAIATAKANEMDITTTIETTSPIQVQTELPIRKSVNPKNKKIDVQKKFSPSQSKKVETNKLPKKLSKISTEVIPVVTKALPHKQVQIKSEPLSVLRIPTTIQETVETVNLVSTTPMPVPEVRQPSELTATTSKSDYTSVIASVPQETFFEYMDGESKNSSEVPVDIRPTQISHNIESTSPNHVNNSRSSIPL